MSSRKNEAQETASCLHNVDIPAAVPVNVEVGVGSFVQYTPTRAIHLPGDD